MHGDGTQSRDFTYVDTVCAVITDAVVRRVSSPDPVNLAFGSRTNLLEVIALLEELLGPPRRGRAHRAAGRRRAALAGGERSTAWHCSPTSSRSTCAPG
ncbi:MAG: hypothetical protein V9E94_20490 [Microthrixaceae bacterium]